MAEEEINIYSVCGIYGLFEHITSYLNAKSILNFLESSFVKQLDQGDGEKIGTNQPLRITIERLIDN